MPANTEAPRIGHGSRVRMHYSITLEDGTVADSSFDEEPIELTMGDGTLVQGLELAILGLQAGDRQTLKIGPENAFGYPDPQAVTTMGRSEFPADMPLEPGHIIGFTTPGGDELPGAIKAVGDDEVTVDFNHPLAGHEITFTVEILDVGEA